MHSGARPKNQITSHAARAWESGTSGWSSLPCLDGTGFPSFLRFKYRAKSGGDTTALCSDRATVVYLCRRRCVKRLATAVDRCADHTDRVSPSRDTQYAYNILFMCNIGLKYCTVSLYYYYLRTHVVPILRIA